MSVDIDLQGQRFGRLVVVSRAPTKNQSKQWLCICDCGKKHIASTTHLRQGRVRSCGCIRGEQLGKLNRTHGASNSLTFKRWKSMLARCSLPNSKSYPRYGGRGITVCARWQQSFENFLHDMGECPGTNWTVERRENNGNYDPSNCRWATRQEQNRNTSRNHLLLYQEELLCVGEWAEILGINARTILTRLNKGMSNEQALGTPVRPCKPRKLK